MVATSTLRLPHAGQGWAPWPGLWEERASGSKMPSWPIFPWGEEGAKDHWRGCAGLQHVADHGAGAEKHSDVN